MKVTDETKQLAQRVVDYIQMFPERHDQRDFFVFNDTTEDRTKVTDANICNTKMCVAGTTVFLAGGVEALREHAHVNGPSFDDSAKKLLGLEFPESEHLFYGLMDDDKALDAVRAIANGDQAKFEEIVESHSCLDVDI